MITTFVRRVVPVLMVGAVMGLLVRVQNLPDVGSDAWFHLRMGNEFLSGWSISRPGHLGRFDSEDWYATQWLSQIAMARGEHIGGVPAVMWLCGAVILLLPFVLYVEARRTTAPIPAALATTVGVLAATPGLSARPQVISYVLIAVVSGAWLATSRDGRARWWLVPLTWAWVTLHGMWVIGILIGVVVVIGMALQRSHDRRHLLRLATIPVLSALVAALTPVGVNAYASLVAVGSRTDHLDEWGPPDFTTPAGLVLVAMAAVVLVAMLRAGPVDWPTVLFFGLALAWALYTKRTTIVSAVMLAPLLAEAFQRWVPKVPSIDRREFAALTASLVVAAGALGIVCEIRGDRDVVPTWVDSRLGSLPPGAGILNDWSIGPYPMWKHPQADLVMHGYVDVFTEYEIQRNVDVTNLEPNWGQRVVELDADMAFVESEGKLHYALVHSLGWSVVEADEDFALLSPPPG